MSTRPCPGRCFANPYAASGGGTVARELVVSAAAIEEKLIAHAASHAATEASKRSLAASMVAADREHDQRVSLFAWKTPIAVHAIKADFPIRPLEEAIAGMEHKTPLVYEGYAGVAYALLQMHSGFEQLQPRLQRLIVAHETSESGGDAELVNALQKLVSAASSSEGVALAYARHANDLLAHRRKHAQHPLPPSFYCGTGGVDATLALAAVHRQNDEALLDQAVTSLLSPLEHVLRDQEMPDEVLYGRAGYLHALLLVRARLISLSATHRHIAALTQAADSVFDVILARGVAYEAKHADCPLMWEWHGKKYLGAAHGVVGILHVLMQLSWRLVPGTPDADRVRALIAGTMDYCLGLRLASGNFPTCEVDSPDHEPHDRQVQWCHGATGLAIACIKASSVLGDTKYLDAARELADVVWERGLLKKGLGLCHGIGGNGYVFLKMYEATRDSRYLDRACGFASFALVSIHSAELLAHPDEPSSLGNGRAGFCCFAMDLMEQLSRRHERKRREAKCVIARQEGAEAYTTASEEATAAAAEVNKSVCFPGLDVIDAFDRSQPTPCAAVAAAAAAAATTGTATAH